MSRFSDRQASPAAHFVWPHLLLGAAVLGALGALAALLLTDDPSARTVALTLLAAVPISQMSVFLVQSLRSGRVAGTDRAAQPAAYWSATFGLLLFILLLAGALALALTD